MSGHMQFTSPRLRGEVAAQRRVRGGCIRQRWSALPPLAPALSPQAGRGGRVEVIAC
jgi:hypothetical protein